MNLHFKLAQEKDIPDILDMMESFYAIDHYPFGRDRSERSTAMFIQNPDLGRLWLISSDHSAVGYVVLSFGFSFEYGGRVALIDELFLKDTYRSKGIGGQVIDFLIAEAKDLDITTLHLEVEAHNEAGSRLYAKKGFSSKDRKLLSRSID